MGGQRATTLPPPHRLGVTTRNRSPTLVKPPSVVSRSETESASSTDLSPIESSSEQKITSLSSKVSQQSNNQTQTEQHHRAPSTPKWSNILILGAMHTGALVGYAHLFQADFHLKTVQFAALLGLLTGLGVTVGAHRLWSHRAFKARLPLRVLLLILETAAMNGSVYSFARDHRTHHRWSDTEADPKNPPRGLFFSHIGWWLVKKCPAVLTNGRKLDYSDLTSDPLVWAQHVHYKPLFILLGVVLPTLVPVLGWGETVVNAVTLCVLLRTLVVLHHYFTVNSLAHWFGVRPYNSDHTPEGTGPTDNRLVRYLSMGEGDHNYHHQFPGDYRSSEKPAWRAYNPSTAVIDLFAALGLAYDLKTASEQVVRGTVRRKGDPGYFEAESHRKLSGKIAYALLDYTVGLLTVVWIMYPVVAYKYWTGQRLFL